MLIGFGHHQAETRNAYFLKKTIYKKEKMLQTKARLGLLLDRKLKVFYYNSTVLKSITNFFNQVTEVLNDGACRGQLQVGDVITHVDSESVVGKDPQAVIELCSNSFRVILSIDRPGIISKRVFGTMAGIATCFFRSAFVTAISLQRILAALAQCR